MPDNVGRDEYDHGTGGRGVDVGGRREEAGNQADQVGDQHEDRQGGDQREEGAAMLAHGLDDHVLDAADDDFHEVLKAAGDRLDRLGGQNGQHQQQDDHEPGVDDGIGAGTGDVQRSQQACGKIRETVIG